MSEMATYGVMPTNGKIDMKPKAWHGYAVILFILGTLVPPLGMCPCHPRDGPWPISQQPSQPVLVSAKTFGSMFSSLSVGTYQVRPLALPTPHPANDCAGHGHNFYIQVRSS
jgi:hypothetical protein